MTNPREALEEASSVPTRIAEAAANAVEPTEAAARIQALETSLEEAEGRVIAEVVAWLRDRKEMSGYYIDYVETSQAADILETGEWRNAQSV